MPSRTNTEVRYYTFIIPAAGDVEVPDLCEVMSIRGQTLKRARYPLSPHPSGGSVFGTFYYSTIINMKNQSIPRIIARKSPSEHAK